MNKLTQEEVNYILSRNWSEALKLFRDGAFDEIQLDTAFQVNGYGNDKYYLKYGCVKTLEMMGEKLEKHLSTKVDINNVKVNKEVSKPRLVIYTQSGAVIKVDNFTNLNANSDTLYFEQVGYDGDNGKCFFKNIAGYIIFK